MSAVLQHAALQHPPLQLDMAVITVIAYLNISYLHFSIGIFPFPSLCFVLKNSICFRLVQKSIHSLAAHYNSMLLVRSPGRRWLLLSPLLATQEVNFRSYECGQPPLQQAAPSPQPAPA